MSVKVTTGIYIAVLVPTYVYAAPTFLPLKTLGRLATSMLARDMEKKIMDNFFDLDEFSKENIGLKSILGLSIGYMVSKIYGNENHWENAVNCMIYDTASSFNFTAGVTSAAESLDTYLKTSKVEPIEFTTAIFTELLVPIYSEKFDNIVVGIDYYVMNVTHVGNDIYYTIWDSITYLIKNGG